MSKPIPHPLMQNPPPAFPGLNSLVGLDELVAGGKPVSLLPLSEPTIPDLALLTWQQSMLMPLLGPAFRDAWQAATQMRISELRQADLTLDAAILDPKIRQNSTSAGHALLEAITSMRGDRGLKRYGVAVSEGELPGHFVVVAGLFLALRLLPLRQAMLLWMMAEIQLSGIETGDVSWTLESVNALVDSGNNTAIRGVA